MGIAVDAARSPEHGTLARQTRDVVAQLAKQMMGRDLEAQDRTVQPLRAKAAE